MCRQSLGGGGLFETGMDLAEARVELDTGTVPPIEDNHKIRRHFSDNSYYLYRLADGAIFIIITKSIFPLTYFSCL